MAEREKLTNEKDADVERKSEYIRQELAKEGENLSQTVDQIGERIKEKLDWREYVRDSPYLSIGVAAGLGYLASRIFRKRRTPLERIMEAVDGDVCDSIGSSLFSKALLGIATRTAADLIVNVITTAETHSDAGPRPQTERDSAIDPTNMDT